MELDGFKDLEQQRQAREDFFEKAFDPTYIEKGRRGGTGEIRQWKDGKYQKQSDGTWKPVKDGGSKSSKENKEDSSSLVGKKFNHEGLTYQVTKQGATQSEAVAITESKKGKRITIDNKVIEKQAGGKTVENKSVGSTHEYNGKKYKKQSNGKWLEVSESHGITKKEHNYQANYSKEMSEKPSLHTSKHEDAEKWHKTEASKLSDKEHTDEEVGLGSKKEDSKKSEESPYSEEKKKLFEEVREWSGDFPDEVINSVYDQIYGKKGAAGFTVSRSNSSTGMSEKVNQKVKELMTYTIDQRTLEGNPSKSDIQDIVWGLLMSKNS